jgi:hypothetical protein
VPDLRVNPADQRRIRKLISRQDPEELWNRQVVYKAGRATRCVREKNRPKFSPTRFSSKLKNNL